jgi:hypothetical protein
MFIILRRSTFNIATLKSVYFAYVQSHLQFGIICWGDSTSASVVFQTQKKIIRAMLGFRYKKYYKALKSGRELFQKLDILTLPSLFAFLNVQNTIENTTTTLSNKIPHTITTRAETLMLWS